MAAKGPSVTDKVKEVRRVVLPVREAAINGHRAKIAWIHAEENAATIEPLYDLRNELVQHGYDEHHPQIGNDRVGRFRHVDAAKVPEELDKPLDGCRVPPKGELAAAGLDSVSLQRSIRPPLLVRLSGALGVFSQAQFVNFCVYVEPVPKSLENMPNQSWDAIKKPKTNDIAV